jgi:hypothetical protein
MMGRDAPPPDLRATMLLLLSILLIGVLVGLGLGGDPRNLGDVSIRFWWLIPLALLLQIVPIPQGDTGPTRLLPVAAVLLSYVALIVAILANWRLRGFLLILVGVVLNFIVIGMNHGMPVTEGALERAENPELQEGLPGGRGAKHHLATERDVLLPLADVIAFGQPFGVVVSAGDVAIDVGGSMFLASAILGRPERPRRRSKPPPRTAPQAEMWGTRR